MSLRESATFDRSPARPAAPIGKVPCATPPYRTWLGRLAVSQIGKIVVPACKSSKEVLLARSRSEARGEYGTVVFTTFDPWGCSARFHCPPQHRTDLPELRLLAA